MPSLAILAAFNAYYLLEVTYSFSIIGSVFWVVDLFSHIQEQLIYICVNLHDLRLLQLC